MRPTERLMQEHEVIAKGLAILRAMAERIDRGEAVAPGAAARLLDFFVAFADEHHHAREERLLFPALVEAGLPAEHGPVGVMLKEHEIGRTLVRRLREAAPAIDHPGPARAEFVEATAQFSDLLGNHIHKENGILFRLADQAFTPRQATGLEEAFERIEQEALARNAPHLRAVDDLGRIFLAQSGSGERRRDEI